MLEMLGKGYEEKHIQLNSGDLLALYSDGVTETQNQAGEEFGPLRLNDVIARNLNASAAGIRDKIEAIVRKAQGPMFNNAAQAWNHGFYWNSLTPATAAPTRIARVTDAPTSPAINSPVDSGGIR